MSRGVQTRVHHTVTILPSLCYTSQGPRMRKLGHKHTNLPECTSFTLELRRLTSRPATLCQVACLRVRKASSAPGALRSALHGPYTKAYHAVCSNAASFTGRHSESYHPCIKIAVKLGPGGHNRVPLWADEGRRLATMAAWLGHPASTTSLRHRRSG